MGIPSIAASRVLRPQKPPHRLHQVSLCFELNELPGSYAGRLYHRFSSFFRFWKDPEGCSCDLSYSKMRDIASQSLVVFDLTESSGVAKPQRGEARPHIVMAHPRQIDRDRRCDGLAANFPGTASGDSAHS